MVSLGVMLLYTPAYRHWDWSPPFRAPKAIVVAFFLSNVFLAIVPLVPPAPGRQVYHALPYWVSLFPPEGLGQVSDAYSLTFWCRWVFRSSELHTGIFRFDGSQCEGRTNYLGTGSRVIRDHLDMCSVRFLCRRIVAEISTASAVESA